MNKRFTGVLLVVGLAALAYMIWHLGIGAIVENVNKVKWWFIPIVAVWGIVYALNAWAIYILINQKEAGLTYETVLKATISSFAINYITPFLNLGGEPYRAAVLKTYIGGHRAVSSVVSYNIVRWMGHCFFWIFTGLVALATVPMSGTVMVLLIAALGVIVALIAGFAALQKYGFLERIWQRVSRLFPRGKRRTWFESKLAALNDIDARMRTVYADNQAGFAKAIAVETLSRLIATLEFVFIMKGIWDTPSYRDALLLNGVSSLVLNLLFFIPFELGAREGSLYMILNWIGYTAALGIFIGLINRARELVWILIGLALIPFSPGRDENWKKGTLKELEENP